MYIIGQLVSTAPLSYNLVRLTLVFGSLYGSVKHTQYSASIVRGQIISRKPWGQCKNMNLIGLRLLRSIAPALLPPSHASASLLGIFTAQEEYNPQASLTSRVFLFSRKPWGQCENIYLVGLLGSTAHALQGSQACVRLPFCLFRLSARKNVCVLVSALLLAINMGFTAQNKAVSGFQNTSQIV
jgi:hypothetical protein